MSVFTPSLSRALWFLLRFRVKAAMEIFGVYTVQSAGARWRLLSPSLTDLQVYAKRGSSRMHTHARTHTYTGTHRHSSDFVFVQ